MKIRNNKGGKGYFVLSVSDLKKWNLRFLKYQDGKIIHLCGAEFFVKKVVNYDDMFIYLVPMEFILTEEQVKNNIRLRAPNVYMDDKDFFEAHKYYKKELEGIREKSYKVREEPEDFLSDDMKKEVAKWERKIKWELKWLQNWEGKAGEKTLQNHKMKIKGYKAEISRIMLSHNVPDESDLWSDSETKYEDFELYHF